MKTPETCFICRKHRGLEQVPGGPVYEDERVFAGHCWSVEDQLAPYLGAFIVEPKRHLPSWAELSDGESETVGKVIRDVARGLKELGQVEHIYVFVLGHQVPHLHIWVMPRYVGTPREFWGLELFNWPERPVGDAAGVEAICAKLRFFLT